MRCFLTTAAAAVAVAVLTGPVLAFRAAAAPSPTQLTVTADLVVTGKVTTIKKDLVETPSPYPWASGKHRYQIAVVRVETVLSGAGKPKEIRVGIFRPERPAPGKAGGIRPPGGPATAVELKEGQQLLLFLTKHPSADFYLMPGLNAPIDVTTDAGKKAVEEVKRVTAVLADPLKALKSDKPEARAEAAVVMVAKHRSITPFAERAEPVAVDAEESRLILKGLTEGEWKGQFGGQPNGFTAFQQLGLTEKDGWIPPAIGRVPGQPAPDFAAIHKDAFTKWLAGAGKDYRVKKLVPKK